MLPEDLIIVISNYCEHDNLKYLNLPIHNKIKSEQKTLLWYQNYVKKLKQNAPTFSPIKYNNKYNWKNECKRVNNRHFYEMCKNIEWHRIDIMIKHYKIKHFPKELVNLTNIKKLTIRECSFNFLPQELYDMPLELFSMIGNYLYGLSKDIKKMKNLKYLNLNNNHIKILPNELFKLVNLTELILGGNNISILPKQMELTNLVYLNLSRNKIETIPENWIMPNLEFLDLADNKIKSFPKIKADKLISLLLCNNNLEKIDDNIFDFPNLEHLEVNYNSISELPPGIQKLLLLKEFKIHGNKLIQLPNELVNLTHLQDFSLDYDLIKKIPKELALNENIYIRYYYEGNIREVSYEIRQLLFN